MIKNIISVLIATSSIALSNTSLADQYNWSGVTLGGGLGVAQMKSTLENRTVGDQHYFTSYGDAVNFQSSPALGFANISLGIQKQYSNFLIGVDLDHSLSSFEQSRQQIGLFDTNDFETKINNITSFSGKLGYAFDNNLIYGKLGMANVWKKYGKYEFEVIELNRLCCIDDTPKNTESYFISKTIKWLKNNTKIKTIISYADPEYNHSGIIYRATHFKHIGFTSKGKVIMHNGKKYHDKTIRTKNNGKLKPYAERLKQALESGDAFYKTTQSKNIYLYELRNTRLRRNKESYKI